MKNKTQEKPLQYDVIIAYNRDEATSANDAKNTDPSPFSKNGGHFSCNDSYKYFLEQCEEEGLRAAFSTTDDISGPGLFSSIWVIQDTWKRIQKPAYSKLIFDKFSKVDETNLKKHTLLISDPGEIVLFHNETTRESFTDKNKTYEDFPNVAIPTVKINLSSEKNISTAQIKLSKIIQDGAFANDFNGSFVVKDRFGAGGNKIFKAEKTEKLLSIGKENPDTSFVLQPFITTSNFGFQKNAGPADLRVVISNGVIVQSYVRIPKKGNFRANASLGAQLKYITTEEIPEDIKKMSHEINEKLTGNNAFYALDFVKSNTGRLYFIEGNITPGLNWYDPEDEIRTKMLIRLIIQSLKEMV